MNELDRVAKNLEIYRALKGVSIAGLARRSGISTTTLSKTINGHVDDLKIGTVGKIADSLDITIDMLLQDSTDEEIAEKAKALYEKKRKEDDLALFYPFDDNVLMGNPDYTSCLMEFLVYLPLINPLNMYRMFEDRIGGKYITDEDYIVRGQLKKLVHQIPESPAKEYAHKTVAAMKAVRVKKDILEAAGLGERILDEEREAYLGIIEKRRRFFESLEEAAKEFDSLI